MIGCDEKYSLTSLNRVAQYSEGSECEIGWDPIYKHFDENCFEKNNCTIDFEVYAQKDTRHVFCS